MYFQEAYVDVSLACAGRLYPAHKFVLSTCSDYFKEMFSKNPCKHPIVFMKDVSTKDMEALLDFMYKVRLFCLYFKEILCLLILMVVISAIYLFSVINSILNYIGWIECI